MAKPCSADLRQRALALVHAGQSRRAVARLLELDRSMVILRVRQFDQTGRRPADPMGGRRRFALLGECHWLLARIAAVPDRTGRALRADLAERGIRVSYDAVWRLLREERLTCKKGLRAAGQDRPDVARKRERWKRHQGRIDPHAPGVRRPDLDPAAVGARPAEPVRACPAGPGSLPRVAPDPRGHELAAAGRPCRWRGDRRPLQQLQSVSKPAGRHASRQVGRVLVSSPRHRAAPPPYDVPDGNFGVTAPIYL